MLWLRRLHRWIGLTVLLPILVMGASGTVLVVASCLESWQAPRLSVAAPAQVDAPAVIAAAMRDAPDGLVAAHYMAGAGFRPAAVDLARAGMRQPAQRVWVDPANFAVLARDVNPDGATGWVRRLHESLFVPMPIGRSLVGWFGVGLVLLVITGVPIWLPPRGRRVSGLRVARNARGARLLRELHSVVAIWLILPLAFQGISGVSMAFPVTIRAMLGLPAMRRPQAGGHEHAAPAPDIAAIVARAEAALPGTRVQELRLPNGSGPATARLQRAGAMSGAPAPMVMIAADGSRVVRIDDPAQTPALAALGWLRALHTAAAGGPVWYALEGLAGLALPLLSVTGGALWLVRRRRRARQRTAALLAAS